jgi:transcriptional regulator with XRE-family HTH domain
VNRLKLVERLVAARKQARLSQADVAARLGVTQTAVSYWENGKREISLSEAVAYAEVVGLTLGLRMAR